MIYYANTAIGFSSCVVCREKGNCKVQIISELPLYLVHFILIKMERLTCFRPQFNLPLDILGNHPALWK